MPEQILYESTNRNLTLEQLLRIKKIDPNIKGPFTDSISFFDAIVMAQAPDTGLFVPIKIPQISLEELASLKGKPFADSAYLVFRKFLTEKEISNDNLRKLVDECYDFEFPLKHLEDRKYLLMHTESPTGDFKNTGARANAKFLQYMMEPGWIYIRITSTSGDTGGAVGLADHDVPGLISIILYPKESKGEISLVQEDIIKKIGDNVYAVAVLGADFSPIQDDMAKVALADAKLREILKEMKIGLTSGNSINWGRLMPQIAHYVYAYAQLADPIGERALFSTGLGNMGHGTAGEYARLMGLPIFNIWPSNENDHFPRYTKTGVYKPLTEEELIMCESKSMNVKNSSNLARVFYLYGGNVDKDGYVNLYPDRSEIQKNIYSPMVSMKEEDQTIIDVYNKSNKKIIIEPHGACSVHGLEQYMREFDISPDVLCIAQVTANPYKFKEHIRDLIEIEPPKPKAFEWFDGREITGTTMPFGYEHLREFILDVAKQVRSAN